MKISKIVRSDLKEITRFLQSVFISKDFTYDYLTWLYFKNPNGNVLGFNAFIEEKIVGHYALIPLQASINGRKKTILLSLNTGIDKEYRNKKLFIELAKKTFSYAIEKDYDHVIGVANANSIRGFEKYLGFEVLHNLDAIITFALPKYKKRESFIVWDEDNVNWRLSSPKTKFFTKKGYIFSSFKKIFTAIHSMREDQKNLKKKTLIPPFLVISSRKAYSFNKLFTFKLPNAFKPSPLVLIRKDLNKSEDNLDNLLITSIDFDIF